MSWKSWNMERLWQQGGAVHGEFSHLNELPGLQLHSHYKIILKENIFNNFNVLQTVINQPRHNDHLKRSHSQPFKFGSLAPVVQQYDKRTCISVVLFPVYRPLQVLYSCHIHPFTHTFTHWWQRLPCKVPICSSGATRGSVSCSRILEIDTQPGELRDSNQRP